MSDKWNINQVLCWIVTRNLSQVEPKWRGQYIAAITFATDSEQNKIYKKIGSSAPELLLQKLREGLIKARGRKNGAGDLEPISPNSWQDLIFDLIHFRAVPDFGVGGTYWTSLCFSKKEALEVFRTEGDDSGNVKWPKHRPNHTDAIRQEYERRRDANELCQDWKKECGSLFEWSKINGPAGKKPLSKEKTIRTSVIQEQAYIQDCQKQQERVASEKQKKCQ